MPREYFKGHGRSKKTKRLRGGRVRKPGAKYRSATRKGHYRKK